MNPTLAFGVADFKEQVAVVRGLFVSLDEAQTPGVAQHHCLAGIEHWFADGMGPVVSCLWSCQLAMPPPAVPWTVRGGGNFDRDPGRWLSRLTCISHLWEETSKKLSPIALLGNLPLGEVI